MAIKAKTRQPSPAQLRARRKFAAAAKARAKAVRAAKKAGAPKKRASAKAPSAAQLRARKKFAAAAKARAKAARAGKRNSTNIRARRIDHLDVAKVHNGGAGDLQRLEMTLRILKGDLAYRSKAPLAAMPEDYINRADWKIDVQRAIAKVKEQIALHHLKNKNPRRGFRAVKGYAKTVEKRLTARGEIDAKHFAKLARKDMAQLKAWKRRKPSTSAALEARRKNAEHRDAQHPIHVTDYWQGRKGYKTQWQRAHEAGQRQLFGVKNPTGNKAFEVKVTPPASTGEAAYIHRLHAPTASIARSRVLQVIRHVHGQAAARKTKIVVRALNGTPARSAARAANGAGAALARKRRAEFVGRPSKKTIATYAPKGSGAKPHSTLVAMGKLKKVYIKGRTPLNFNGAAILAHDPKTDKMFVLGREYTLKHLKKNPDGFEDLGEVTRIEYEATKTHLGDETPVTYFHKLGEEGGEKPHAVINEENLLLLEGGDYYITPEGIRD